MKNITFFFSFLFLFTGAEAQWTQQYSSVNSHLLRTHFFNRDTGIVMGAYGVILRTVDGGTNWITRSSGTTADLYASGFNSKGFGLAAGNSGAVTLTMDFGVTWWVSTEPKQSNGQDINFRSCFVFRDEVFYLTGSDGTIYKIEDQGTKWTSLKVNTSQAIYGVFFLDENLGYASGIGFIKKTTDGGQTWTDQTCPTGSLLSGIWFTDSLTGFISGQDGSFLRTTDGENWVADNQDPDDNLGSMYFTDAQHGYMIGGDVAFNSASVFTTTDGGLNWVKTALPYSRLYSGCFLPAGVAYVCGLDGLILKNINLPAGITPQNTNVFAAYPNPVSSAVHIKLNKDIPETEVRVFNNLGHLVHATMLHPENGEASLELSHLPRGIYLVHLSGYNQALRISKL